ncbi:MAG TPA: hypothetical protein VIL48_16665 [Acidimicrobiales bacterium]
MEEPDMVRRAEKAVDDRTAPPPGRRKYAAGSRPDELRAEQRDEAAQAWGGPGVPVMTDAQAKGFAVGSIVGGAIGILVLLPVALIPFLDPALARVLVVVVIGALAGGTVGALYLGGRAPELEGETLDADGRGSVGTTVRDPHTDGRGR